jgi:hypothetical protein
MAFTLDTTLGEILDHPQAKAVLDKYVPWCIQPSHGRYG